jgi:hypothetical protein
LRATVEGNAEGLDLEKSAVHAPKADAEAAVLAFTATGNDPFELTRQSMQAVAEYLRAFVCAKTNLRPNLCSIWVGAPGTRFTTRSMPKKVLAGLRSFQNGGVAPWLRNP